MDLYVSQYSKHQGKSFTTKFEIKDLYLDVDSHELTIEAYEDGQIRSFKYRLEPCE